MADSRHMRAVTFADVLDAALRRVSPEPVRVAVPSGGVWAAGGAPQSATAFLFVRPLTTAVPRWTAASATEPRRPDHALSDDQRRALNRLLDLGARLNPNFTAAELRREYRRLAHRYHPDRHSGGGPVEPGGLTRTFADLTEPYRCLRALVEPRH